jgi:hypothetical protein
MVGDCTAGGDVDSSGGMISCYIDLVRIGGRGGGERERI